MCVCVWQGAERQAAGGEIHGAGCGNGEVVTNLGTLCLAPSDASCAVTKAGGLFAGCTCVGSMVACAGSTASTF